jgi:hypothetical protein
MVVHAAFGQDEMVSKGKRKSGKGDGESRRLSLMNSTAPVAPPRLNVINLPIGLTYLDIRGQYRAIGHSRTTYPETWRCQQDYRSACRSICDIGEDAMR